MTGDLNHHPGTLAEIDVWRSLGWKEVQEIAQERWGQPVQPTCKGATVRDFIFVSPEAAAMLHEVSVGDIFSEHSLVTATLAMPVTALPRSVWPLPSEIPWQHVDLQRWHASAHAPVPPQADSTVWFRGFARALETSLDGHMQLPGAQLPSSCHGRGATLAPTTRAAQCVSPKPGRHGDEAPHHDLLSKEVKRWFQQLRRIQSLCHALKQARQSVEAVEYRTQLWKAILGAKGFRQGFASWWHSRPVQHVGCPPTLPFWPPSGAVCQCIFEDFRANFRRFEAWHIRRRIEVLSSRYKQVSDLLVKDLRDPVPEQVDCLVHHRVYEVLAVDTAAVQLHTDPPVDLRGTSEWKVGDFPVEVVSADGPTCQLAQPLTTVLIDEIEQTQTLSAPEHIQDEFIKVWKSRWNQHALFAPFDWSRVLNFARAFLPTASFCVAPITASQWLEAARRYRPRAARGPDGFARDDLLHMPSARVEELVALLNSIESGRVAWPQQFLTAFVCALTKGNGRQDVQGYRPICLMSIIYRTWSGIRARQLLRFLEQWMPWGASGFMPGRDTSDIWFLIGAQVEAAVQQGHVVCGYSTDIVKAFNGLPRQPLLEVAGQLGVPAGITQAWGSFIGGLQKRFMIMNTVSQPVMSCSGFPEGCPLSPVAMCIADILLHFYMRAFQPGVTCLSFVDNLSGTCDTAFDVVRGLQATETFCDMLTLELDKTKTYVWSTALPERKVLAESGYTVAQSVRELGGILSFSARVRNKALVSRCESLDPLFKKLGAARSPLSMKFTVLPLKFWARALHGVAGCPLADVHLQKLRVSAVRALKLMSAGASVLLRLSLSPQMEADPGFYQLWVTVQTVRRMCLRSTHILLLWQAFVEAFDGSLFHGPFSKLFQVLHPLGWSARAPPLLVDEEGLSRDLLACPLPCLRQALERAWLRWVGLQHQHRPSFAGLNGIDLNVVRADQSRLTPLQLSRQSALQAGALMFGHAKAKFDLSESGFCEICHEPDTKEHRVCHCPMFAQARRKAAWICDRWTSLPPCLTHHLLVPANAFGPALRAALSGLPAPYSLIWSTRVLGDRQHLFTDGAGLFQGHTDLALSAWAVVNATTGYIVAGGPLAGLAQTVPRAELTAVLVAIEWTLQQETRATIWSDALNVVKGVQQLLDGTFCWDSHENHDLWQQVRATLISCDLDVVRVRHVPSHLDPSKCETQFEEWLAAWNGRADLTAGLCNLNRTWEFAQLHAQAKAVYDSSLEQVRALRMVYDAIADMQPPLAASAEPEVEEVQELAPTPLQRSASLEDSLRVGWKSQLAGHQWTVPIVFVESVVQFLAEQDATSETVFRVSWIELLVMYLTEGADFPVADGSGQGWVMPTSLPFNSRRLTVASQLRLFRQTARKAFTFLDVGAVSAKGVSLIDLGFSTPFDGLVVGCDLSLRARARQRLADFAGGRRISTAAALARPLAG